MTPLRKETSMDILRISRHPELLPQAAAWFHGKWGIPLSAYEESMEEALKAARGGAFETLRASFPLTACTILRPMCAMPVGT